MKLTVPRFVKKCSASYYNPKVHCRLHNSPSPDSILSLTSWIQTTNSYTVYLWSILILSHHICVGVPNGLSLSGFANTILYAFVFIMDATCLAHLVILHFITLTLFVRE